MLPITTPIHSPAALFSMPPLEPLPSEQAAFSKHLFLEGYPLWNPDPVLLPQGLQGVGLRIGDVGTVDEQGQFDTFFNILDPSPGSEADTPPIFPPIDENDVHCSSEDISPREVISSPKTSWDVEQLDVETTTGVKYVLLPILIQHYLTTQLVIKQLSMVPPCLMTAHTLSYLKGHSFLSSDSHNGDCLRTM